MMQKMITNAQSERGNEKRGTEELRKKRDVVLEESEDKDEDARKKKKKKKKKKKTQKLKPGEPESLEAIAKRLAEQEFRTTTTRSSTRAPLRATTKTKIATPNPTSTRKELKREKEKLLISY